MLAATDSLGSVAVDRVADIVLLAGNPLEHIGRTPAIRDVLVSGGDPLSLSDARLVDIVARLRAIEHVDVIRLCTRMPVTMPQRITQELLQALARPPRRTPPRRPPAPPPRVRRGTRGAGTARPVAPWS